MDAQPTLMQLANLVIMNENGSLEVQMEVPSIPADKTPKKRTRKTVACEHRCCARVWSNGTGSRCQHKKKEGCGDFCSFHYTQSLVADGKMFQFNEEGKHIGLFWGRFDQLNRDGSIPFMVEDADGKEAIVCQWKNDVNKAAVLAARKNGAQFHVHSGEHKTRTTRRAKSAGKPTKRTKNAYMFFLDSVRSTIRAELEQTLDKVRVTDVAKKAGPMWKEMDAEKRAPFVLLAQQEKERKAAEQTLEDGTPLSKVTLPDGQNYLACPNGALYDNDTHARVGQIGVEK